MNKILFTAFLLLSIFSNAFADEVRMAYAEITESSTNNYEILLKTPIKKNRKINLNIKFPSECKKTSKIQSQLVKKAYLTSWDIKCNDGLVGKKIYINGLKAFKTDMLLELNLLNKNKITALLTPDNSSYEVAKIQTSFEVIKTYTLIGIEHILEGFDHLLFVLSLLLIVKKLRTLIWTITAFTLAHSITLAGASLGYLSLPSAPVESIIALSIMFLAMEVIHQERGVEGIASRFPWIVSFTFGLLHGFGFAGALSEIGLPQDSVPLALLFFNVGVEIGQLIFVSVMIVLGFIIKKMLTDNLLKHSKILLVYGIGSVASFWFIDRVLGF